ncbi:MAG: FecR domain-containing protein [Clostridia bacterium]|nr:FecR domain-containing protein [Clostridia bacterium]
MSKTGKKPSVKAIVLIVVAVLVVAAGIITAAVLTHRPSASTIRLIRAEGAVTVEDGSGKTVAAAVNTRMQSGQKLATGADSVATVSLDDTKLASLDENSRVGITKSGRALELEVIEGNVFFDVMKKLRDDETFDVKTSTMVVGIRGTSGVVGVTPGGHSRLMLTDGEVDVKVVDPESGEVKETVNVKHGESLEVKKDKDGVTFEKDVFTKEDLPAFALVVIEEEPGDSGLAERIDLGGAETGPETEPETEIETEPETEIETEPETEIETEPETEIETEPETEIETEPVKGPEDDPAPPAEPTVPEPGPAQEPETEPEQKPEQEPEQKPGPEPGHPHNSLTLRLEGGTEPTCTETGLREHWYCPVCGKTFSDPDGKNETDELEIPATGHKWDGGEITTAPGCETPGVKTYTCLNDESHTKTEEIPAVGHKWNDGEITTAPGCETPGVKTYTCLNDAAHTKTEAVPATGHKWNGGEITTAPGCETPGVKTLTCLNDETNTRTEEIPATGH